MQIDTHAENRSYRLLDLYSLVAGDRGGDASAILA